LLADGTSNTILTALAQGKKNMLEAFLQNPGIQGKFSLDACLPANVVMDRIVRAFEW